MPRWLSGTLVRNGPALYEVGERTFNHWFDGLGMLHAFTLERGRVGYANRFLRSSAYKAYKEEGIIRYSEFATDPCRAIFNGAQATFSLAKVGNANVHVGRLAQHFVALTEVGLPVRFDPRTLRTLGVVGPEPAARPDRDGAPAPPRGRPAGVLRHPADPAGALPGEGRARHPRAAPAGGDPAQGARLHALVRPDRAARGAHRVAVRGGSAEDHHGLGAVHQELPLGAVARRELPRGGPAHRPRHAARDRPALHVPPRERVRARRKDLPRHVRLRRRRRDRRALPREAPRAQAPGPAGRAAALRARPRAASGCGCARWRSTASSCRGSTTGA